jgi:hypothetical protein
VPSGGLTSSDDGRSATLELKNLPVIDQPKWPAPDAPAVPAKMSFRVVWKATDDKILYEDKQKHFRVEGYLATAQVEAAVVVPALNFFWKSDSLETSKAAFAIIGNEVNGRYYDQEFSNT